MRLVAGLGLVGLMFAFFAAVSIIGGRGRDALESGAAGLVLLGAASFLFVRVVRPRLRDRSRVAQLDGRYDRWSGGHDRR
jgi:hypothetical protein